MSGPFHPDQLPQTILRLSTSSIPVESKVEQILQSVSGAFGSDRCLLLKQETLGHEGFLRRLLSEKEALWVDDGLSFRRDGVLPEEEDFIQPSFVCIPLHDEGSPQGILYLGFSEKRTFSPEDVGLLALVAQALGDLIRNAEIHLKAERAVSETTALHELGRVVTSTLKLNDLFELILQTGARILKAKGGVLRLEDKRSGELRVGSALGDYHRMPVDEKIAKRVLLTRTPMSLDHLDTDHPSLSVLSAPLVSSHTTIGTLTFYDKETTPPRFDERDFQLLLTTANQISSSIENALVHYETSERAHLQETRARQLATLWELDKALLTSMDSDRILHTALTMITHGEGLGFNRAMVFRVNEKKRLLEGAMALGPDSAEEAARIWNALSQENGSPLELIAHLPSSPPDSSRLNAIVKGIQIPFERENCFLTRTVNEGKAFNVRFPSTEEGCRLGSESGCAVGESLGRDSKNSAFATVPLMGKGKVIGVIQVDNLYNQRPIADDDIQFLTMVSNQAGLVIENAILYRHLEEVHQELKETQALLAHREKMVALGEMCSTIAHEVKNPLVSIGGFARRLHRSIPEKTQEQRYTHTIITEVARVEKILNDIMHYTNGESTTARECDIRDIIENSLLMVSEGSGNGVRLIKEYAEGLLMVKGDYQQLKQTFFNLITNAHQAVKGQGMINIRAYPISENGSSCVRVEVEDNGPGIDPKHLHHIFNPFYTTKDSSLGLGLATVHQVVTSHRGHIEVDNQPGKGVKFIITLPVGEQNGARRHDVP
jgi:two-component system, NtrC family, sensor histidine kinase HydH